MQVDDSPAKVRVNRNTRKTFSLVLCTETVKPALGGTKTDICEIQQRGIKQFFGIV